MAADTGALKEGDVLVGRYRLVRALGEGGMGIVWEARQLTTDKAVAIKVLKPTSGESSADAARFLREAKVAAGLSHRNIVQVFDYWEVEGNGPVFLVMELLVGATLAHLLEEKGALPVSETVALIAPVASAINAAHALGVIHRDIKPDNIFIAQSLDGDSEVKVLDFGLAKPTAPDMTSTAVTNTGSVMGTPFYMSPEQVYGEKNIDPAADVWSLGVVLYECVVGSRPFAGDNFGQIFRNITQTPARPVRELAPHVPPVLASLIARMLTHDREGRPTMVETNEVLASLSGRARSAAPLPVVTQRIPSAPPQPLHGAASIVASTTSVSSTPANKTKPTVIAAAGLLVAIGLTATVATTFWPRTPRPVGLAPAPATPSASAILVLKVAPAAPASEAAVQVSELPSAAPTDPKPAGSTSARAPSKVKPSAPKSAGSADPLRAGRF